MSAPSAAAMLRSPTPSPLLQPRRATTSRPTTTRGAPLRVLAQKGKGKRYRRELNDPYSGVEKSPENKKPPKQTADAGPINAVFADDEETEEYFLARTRTEACHESSEIKPNQRTPDRNGPCFAFVRKVKKDGAAGESGGVDAAAMEAMEARRAQRSQQMGKKKITGAAEEGGGDEEDEKDDGAAALDTALAGLGMRGPSAPAAAPEADADAAKKSSGKQLGVWLPLGDVVVRAGGDMDVAVAERRGVLTGFAKRKHLKMLPVAADETLEFGLRVQKAPPRGPDPSEVFPVATDEPHASLVWDHRVMGEYGAEKAELRLMNAMPVISSHKKNEMLSSAMGMIKAQQEKAAEKAAGNSDE